MRWFQMIRQIKFAGPRERRLYPRVADTLKVHCQSTGELVPSECVSRDISEGGVRLHLYRYFLTGTSLKLGICLRDNPEPAWVVGKVVWSRETPRQAYPFEAGIKFDFSDSVFRSRLQKEIGDVP